MKILIVLKEMILDFLKWFFSVLGACIIFIYLCSGFGALILFGAIAQYKSNPIASVTVITIVLLSWIAFLVIEINRRLKEI